MVIGFALCRVVLSHMHSMLYKFYYIMTQTNATVYACICNNVNGRVAEFRAVAIVCNGGVECRALLAQTSAKSHSLRATSNAAPLTVS